MVLLCCDLAFTLLTDGDSTDSIDLRVYYLSSRQDTIIDLIRFLHWQVQQAKRLGKRYPLLK